MMQNQVQAHRGLTILELLALVALGGVLSVLLLPALGDVASVSKQTRCLDHLRRVGYANLVYAAQDSKNFALPVHPLQFNQDPNNPTFIGAYDWGGKSGVGRPGFVDGPLDGEFAFEGARYGTKAWFGPASRPLNTILFPGGFEDHLNPVYNREGAFQDTLLELEEMQCPSDTGPPAGAHCPDWLANPGRSSYDHFGTSYNANIFMVGGFSGIWSNSPYLHRLSDIPNPSETLAYQENAGRWAWAVRETDDCSFIGLGVFPEGTVRGWHGKDWMFNAAFIDGHADAIYMNSHRSTRVFDGAIQEQFRCIIMRGPGWRIDTLPLVLIPTGLNNPGGGRPSFEGCVTSE